MENQRMEMDQIVNYTNYHQQIEASKQLKVILTPRVKCNDFVLIKDENNSFQVAKIQQLFDGHAHVTLYMTANELPQELKKVSDTGSKIKFHKRELIEDFVSKNIPIGAIFNKCIVFKAHENESVDEIIQSYNKVDKMQSYVCRYKLVKETIYKLVPVSWQPGEEELRQTTEFSDLDDRNIYTDTDDQSEAVCDLNETINQLQISLMNTSDTSPLVSPIKIVKNTVQKLPRSQSTKKRSSPDAAVDNNDVSPSKRNKLNYGSEARAIRSGKLLSPAQNQMNKIKKNLNDSFTLSTDEEPRSPYHSIIDEKQPLKMVLSKGRPLQERNDIATQSPRYNMARRSILKTTDSAKNTPRRSVMIVERPTMENDSKVDLESTPRRSTRKSSHTASQIIAVTAEDNTPELEKPRTRRSVAVKHSSPPSTPRTTSKQIAAQTPRTPRTPHTLKTPKTPKGVMTPQQTRSLYRSGNLTPSIQCRQETIAGEQSELEMVRERLQVSAVPSSLPCREKEFSNIYEFIMGKLSDGTGGCIYISGVPGTGKTATVTQVIKTIQSESKPKRLPAFDFVDINGMRLTEPRQAYVQIYRQLTGKTLAWAQARDLLESRFTAGSKKAIRPTILLVDELDIICNRKQDVVYNLFDWTIRKGARLIAITIANTMDLPERVLKLKVASRLGLTRITFQPYNFKQLQEVVMTRLAGSKCFNADAVQLVARKVASVSGDCRRALDICRRATEIAVESSTKKDKIEVSFSHINQALSEMFASPKVRAIKNCTKFEKLFLQAVASEITRTGIEEVEFQRVYWQIGTLAPILGTKNAPTEDQAMLICMALAANRLLIAEDSSAGLYQKIILNATVDDLYYALNGS